MGNQQHIQDQLHHYASIGDIGGIKAIQNYVSINSLNQQGESALRLALYKGQLQSLILIQKLGGQIIPPLSYNQSLLHISVRLEHWNIVQYLLSDKQKRREIINQKDEFGITALHMAIAKRDWKMIQLLLRNGASVQIKDNLGRTAKDMYNIVSCDNVKNFKQSFDKLLHNRKHLRSIKKIKEQKNCKVLIQKAKRQYFRASRYQATIIDWNWDLKLHEIWQSQSNLYYDTINRNFSQNTIQSDSTELSQSRSSIKKHLMQYLNYIDQKQLTKTLEIKQCPTYSIYKGLWRNSNVTIKQFHEDFNEQSDLFQNLLSNLKIYSQNRHLNIVIIMGASMYGNKLQIITEHFQQGSLFDVIFEQKKQLTDNQKLSIALDVSNAITFLFSNQVPIIHRNITMQNVFLDQSNVAKIGDFEQTSPLQPKSNKKLKQLEASNTYQFGYFLYQLFTEQPDDIQLKLTKSVPSSISQVINDCIFNEADRFNALDINTSLKLIHQNKQLQDLVRFQGFKYP